MGQALSERQQQILGFITEKQQEGWTPSVREIGAAESCAPSANFGQSRIRNSANMISE